MNKYFEVYRKCGCVSPVSAKKYLLGYCPKHGNDRAELYCIKTKDKAAIAARKKEANG